MINKINLLPDKNIQNERQKNGAVRYSDSKGYYDKYDNGRLEYYNKDGVLVAEASERGFSYIYNPDGKLYSALAPDGELTIYNSDGSVKAKVNVSKKHFSALG